MGNEIGIGAVGKMELHRQAARAVLRIGIGDRGNASKGAVVGLLAEQGIECIDQLRGRNVGISLRKGACRQQQKNCERQTRMNIVACMRDSSFRTMPIMPQEQDECIPRIGRVL